MMKKVLFFAGLAAAVLSLVGCNKEADFFGRNGRKMQIVLTDDHGLFRELRIHGG